ncbi:hypothetical protein ACFV4M_18745 [Kitasatospora indigofera]|uniref:hypothetical protein n=1 Tax=Kitasatospora indigofera TaxID=67307 RepID=UPI00364D6EA5
MRYLTGSFALGALRRGRTIEQFLGMAGRPDRPGIRWVEVRPSASGYLIVLHTAEDVGGEHFHDLVEFPALDSDSQEEDFGQAIATAQDESAAMAIAEAGTGAVPGRWVNAGIAQDDYLDFVRAGRPPHPPATEPHQAPSDGS